MILADKIIDLRKKNNWSQEELAEKLNVSRQSVSKWEGAQAVPDMNKIIRLSELFGVSTDYLLKDDYDKAEVIDQDLPPADKPVRMVSMEEAGSFMEFRNTLASRISIGVMMCILSPILLIVLSAGQASGKIAVSEGTAHGIGLLILFVFVGGAVALFVISSIQNNAYEYLEKDIIETAYGVSGMVRDRRDRFKSTFTAQLTSGIVLCVLSVVPIFITVIILGENADDFYYSISVAVLLLLVAVGVFLIVRSSMIWAGMQMLLEDGSYTRLQKQENKQNEPYAAIYWSVIVCVYLAYSFITMKWQTSWIVWPIAGVLYGAIAAVLHALRSRA